jgi:hypothetical protein
MILIKLYAELQANPRSVATYRKLAEHYKNIGMVNESEAFIELIRKKFNANNSNSNQEQRKNDQGDT